MAKRMMEGCTGQLLGCSIVPCPHSQEHEHTIDCDIVCCVIGRKCVEKKSRKQKKRTQKAHKEMIRLTFRREFEKGYQKVEHYENITYRTYKEREEIKEDIKNRFGRKWEYISDGYK
jgi:hypothetical protein